MIEIDSITGGLTPDEPAPVLPVPPLAVPPSKKPDTEHETVAMQSLP